MEKHPVFFLRLRVPRQDQQPPIGQRLLALRASKNLSQGDIERRTGLLRCYVSRVENGHTIPNLETLQRWANALEVDIYQLFFEGEGKPEPISVDEMKRLVRE